MYSKVPSKNTPLASKYDFLCIGAGVYSLLTSAWLSRLGFSVLVVVPSELKRSKVLEDQWFYEPFSQSFLAWDLNIPFANLWIENLLEGVPYLHSLWHEQVVPKAFYMLSKDYFLRAGTSQSQDIQDLKKQFLLPGGVGAHDAASLWKSYRAMHHRSKSMFDMMEFAYRAPHAQHQVVDAFERMHIWPSMMSLAHGNDSFFELLLKIVRAYGGTIYTGGVEKIFKLQNRLSVQLMQDPVIDVDHVLIADPSLVKLSQQAFALASPPKGWLFCVSCKIDKRIHYAFSFERMIFMMDHGVPVEIERGSSYAFAEHFTLHLRVVLPWSHDALSNLEQTQETLLGALEQAVPFTRSYILNTYFEKPSESLDALPFAYTVGNQGALKAYQELLAWDFSVTCFDRDFDAFCNPLNALWSSLWILHKAKKAYGIDQSCIDEFLVPWHRFVSSDSDGAQRLKLFVNAT